MKSASRIFLGVIAFLAVAAFALTIADSNLFAQTDAQGVQTAVEVISSEPVTPQISPAVRDIQVGRQGPFVNKEINPLRNPGLHKDDLGLTGTDTNKEDPLVALNNTNGSSSPDPIFTFEGLGTDGVTPPDTVGDVGPNHYIQMVNLGFAIFDKAGNVVQADTPFNALFSGYGGVCDTNNDGDPIVLYDEQADRWLLSQFADIFGSMTMCIAISTSPDPTSTYYLYDFQLLDVPDYMKYGVWPDGYYMGTNSGVPNAYYAYAFDRTAMLVGNPATFQAVGGQANLLMPADIDGSTAPPAGMPGFFYTMLSDGYPDHPPGVDRLALYEFDIDWATPANTTFTLAQEIPIAAYNYTVCGFFVGNCIPQPGTAQALDDLSWWPMFRFAYRNFGTHEAAVGNFSVDTNGSDHSGIRWFEIQKSGAGPWTLEQEGTFAPDTDHRWMGSIAMDGSGGIALGYSVSSGTQINNIRYATRVLTDPPGTLRDEATMWVSSGVHTGIDRWGDYSAMSIDPVDDCSYWYTNQYDNSDNVGFDWVTRVGVFKNPECTGVIGASGTLEGTVTDTATSAPIEDALVVAPPSLATTDNMGLYSMTVPTGTVDVTASAYGYLPSTVTGVNIISGTTTTQDFALTVANSYVVDGVVSDAVAGWPLYASINISGDPFDPPVGEIWTDPVTGYYSVTLASNITYTFDVAAWVPGYNMDSREVGPLTSAATEDFSLTVDAFTCIAPGYEPDPGSILFFDDLESGLGNWTTSGLWNAEDESDTCGAAVAPFPSSSTGAYYGNDASCTYDTGAANTGDMAMNSSVAIPAGGAFLKFHSYEETECGGTCDWDKRYIDVSTDGSIWTNIAEGDTEGVWTQYDIDMSAYASQNLWVRFRFDSIDSIGNANFGWMVDDVELSVPSCVPNPGGLVVGNVYDENTSDALNGADVTNESGEATVSMATPADANLDDGFYTLFSPTGSNIFTATLNGYGPDVQMPTVVLSDTIYQDFHLPSPSISVDLPAYEVTVALNTSVTLPLDIINSGGEGSDFTLREVDAGYSPLTISIPTSDGNFQQGSYEVSAGLAPAGGQGVAAPEPITNLQIPDGSMTYGWNATGTYYTIFDLDTPELLPNIATVTAGGNFVGAGEYVEGTVIMIDVANNLYAFDPATGTQLYTVPISPIPPGGETVSGLAFDPTSGVVYASSTNIATSSLFRVDVTTGATTLIGAITNSPANIGIVVDGSGALWGYDIVNDSFMAIDKATGAGTDIGPIGFDANFGQGICYDAATDSIYMVAFNNTAFQPELRLVDTNTGATTSLGVLGSTTPGGLNQLSWCGTELAGDIPWLSENPITGTVAANSTTTVDLTFDATVVTQTGTYSGTLSVNTDDPVNGRIDIPVVMHVINVTPNYGVTVSSANPAMEGEQGSTVSYDVLVSNDGNVVDSYDITLSGNSWTTTVSDSTFVLDAGESTTVTVDVDIPADGAGDMDTVTVTATSNTDASANASLDLTTTGAWLEIYMPLISRWP